MKHQITITMKSGVQLPLLCDHITVKSIDGQVVSIDVKGCVNMKCLFIDLGEVAAITQQLDVGYPQLVDNMESVATP